MARRVSTRTRELEVQRALEHGEAATQEVHARTGETDAHLPAPRRELPPRHGRAAEPPGITHYWRNCEFHGLRRGGIVSSPVFTLAITSGLADGTLATAGIG